MNFDAITLAAVRDEIRDRALGGRVQRVAAPAPDQIALEVYANRATHHLLIHAGHQGPRVHFVPSRLPAGPEPPSPLLLLLRKWVRNGRLVAVDQLPLERVLRLTVQAKPRDLAEPVRHAIVVEIIGRQSNIILVDAQGQIREALRQVPGEGGRRRIWPRAGYEPPPPVRSPPPAEVSPEHLAAQAGPRVPAWRALLQAVAGVSPTLAREALARARIDPEAASSEVADWGEALDQLRDIFGAAEQGDWHPCLVSANGGLQAFAPYELTYLDRPSRAVDSISEALQAFYAADVPPRRIDPAAARLSADIIEAIDRAERRVASLQASLATAAEADRLRWAGETLLAYAYTIRPGAQEFEHDGRTIQLDRTKSATANAQDYFRRYRDRQAAARRVPGLLWRAGLTLEFLKQAADDLARAESPGVVSAIEELLRSTGHLARGRKRPGQSQVGRGRWLLQGHELLTGRTAAENHRVTLRDAEPDDLWFHARGMPGAHVILRRPGARPPDRLVEAAAAAAAYFSAGRDDKRVEVDVTRRRYVRPIPGAGAGQVTYRNERTIRVAPQPPADLGAEPPQRPET